MAQELSTVVQILQMGGPVAVSVFALLAWYFERREVKELQAQLLGLAQAQVAAVVKSEAAIEALTDALDRLRGGRR